MPPANNIRDRPMNLGRAIMWMMRHPWRRLVDQLRHWWRYDGEELFELNARDGDGWVEANILVSYMSDAVFARPTNTNRRELESLRVEVKRLGELAEGRQRTLEASAHEYQTLRAQLVETEKDRDELAAAIEQIRPILAKV